MKYLSIICFIFFTYVGCKPQPKFDSSAITVTPEEEEDSNYLSVTSYLRGQIFEIKESHVNPLEINSVGERKDSAWLKIEDLDNILKDFLSPEIDSTNMKPFFKQEKFIDQSLNAATFTYSPISTLPDSITIRKWDVYINPENGKIIRIYMVKELPQNKQQQLTWQAVEKWCTNRIVSTDSKGNIVIEKEQMLTWNF